MKIKILAALVISALAGAAYADSATTTLSNTLSVHNSVTSSSNTSYSSDTYIDVDEVFDPGKVTGLAEANITNVQKNINNTLTIGMPPKIDPAIATVDKSANDNKGNVGVNNASGFFNNQDNQAAIASAAGKGVTAANAKVDSEQLNSANRVSFNNMTNNPVMSASVTGSANGNAGNVGVNNAAGASNLQANKMAISSADNAALASAHSSSMQVNIGNTVTSWLPVDVTATLSGSANSNAGNVGVNNAAGVSNAQLNSLSMATATH